MCTTSWAAVVQGVVGAQEVCRTHTSGFTSWREGTGFRAEGNKGSDRVGLGGSVLEFPGGDKGSLWFTEEISEGKGASLPRGRFPSSPEELLATVLAPKVASAQLTFPVRSSNHGLDCARLGVLVELSVQEAVDGSSEKASSKPLCFWRVVRHSQLLPYQWTGNSVQVGRIVTSIFPPLFFGSVLGTEAM